MPKLIRPLDTEEAGTPPPERPVPLQQALLAHHALRAVPYLNAIIDCGSSTSRPSGQSGNGVILTREIVGWSLELRCRTDEAIDVVDLAVARHGIEARLVDARHRQRRFHKQTLQDNARRARRHAPTQVKSQDVV